MQTMNKRKYFQCFSNESKKRYFVKIFRIENVDPYTLRRENLNFNTECFLRISYPDIANYLLFAPSPVTAEELKCYLLNGLQLLFVWMGQTNSNKII